MLNDVHQAARCKRTRPIRYPQAREESLCTSQDTKNKHTKYFNVTPVCPLKAEGTEDLISGKVNNRHPSRPAFLEGRWAQLRSCVVVSTPGADETEKD